MTKEEQNNYFLFFDKMVKKDYKSMIEHSLDRIVEPQDIVKNLSVEDKEVLKAKLTEVIKLANTVNKKIGAEEIYMINKTLREYGLQLAKSFCKIELSLAIVDSVCRELTNETSYIENVAKALEELFPSDLLDY